MSKIFHLIISPYFIYNDVLCPHPLEFLFFCSLGENWDVSVPGSQSLQ